MAAGAEVSRTLKEALYEALNAILSQSQEVRNSAEEQLKILEVTDEFCVHLAELTVDPHGPFAIRQLASVLLKQYVDTHWSRHAEKFRQPEATEEAKATIRQLLPLGLKESLSKVRSSVAYAISAIAHWDWPEAWPQLFDILMQALTSGDSNAVHGAMRVLTEFSRDISENQMFHVAPVVLPEMYKIFAQPEKYSIRTRGRAVEIFSTCAQSIATMGLVDKNAAKTLLYPILPQFTEALVGALKIPDGPTSDSGIKKEILKALTVLVKNEPKQMSTWLPHILTPVWDTLTESANIYVKTVVNDSEEADDPVDSDGEVLGFENVVFMIFDFVSALVETPRFRGLVKKGLSELIYYIVFYMQITEEQVRTWTSSPDRFVEDEDDDTFSYSVRISAQDLLLSLFQEYEDESARGLSAAVTKHLQESSTARTNGDPYWWKIHESCMLALGAVCDILEKVSKKGQVHFDLRGFLESVVLVDINTSGSPFLVGRCLWVSSKFPESMTPDMMQRFLRTTADALQPSQPPTLRVSAVRTVWGFCDYLSNSNQSGQLAPFLGSFTEGLLTLAMQFSSDVLALVMEALSIVIAVDNEFTHSVESRISPLATAIFLKYNSDPVLVSICQDIFKELCRNPLCCGSLQQRLLPTLISILQASVDKIPSGLQGVSLDVLETIVRSSSTPLSDALINQAFPTALHCILHTDDNSTLQYGGECIRAYVSVAFDQIAAWRDDQGQSGVYYVVKVAQHLLDPKTPESAATFVGRLVSVLLSKAGPSLGEWTDVLLRAVLSKLQQTASVTVTQSLVLVFAHLVHTQMSAVLDFLSGVPGPTGQSALAFVLTEWCSRQTLFYGSYENKVSILALCKLLEHGIQNNDPRLADISVKGDRIINLNEGIRTRAKTAASPEQWTEIPLLVKMYKLMIHELGQCLDAAIVQREDESDTDDDEWEDNGEMDEAGCSQIMSQFAPASDYTGYDYEAQDGDEDDPDALADPISSMNMESCLVQFLRSLTLQPCFATFSQHHTSQELQILQTAGVIS
ncbi:importin-9-like [Ornithodoros turicata]|uniref:Putative importin 9 n=1 Tax=Ornithodoros turicata TaxID=34597 RepID=A0A2R5L784_9ACAR